jgi:hypothetical protein
MSSNQIDLLQERKLFELAQEQKTDLLFERVEYIAALNAYMPKYQYADHLIVMQAAERFNFGWISWQARAKVHMAFNANQFVMTKK